MYHSIDVYDDDLPVLPILVLRVCFRVSRSLPFVGLSTAICSKSRGSRFAGGSEILRTVYSKGWATNRPPTKRTINEKVALSGVTLWCESEK